MSIAKPFTFTPNTYAKSSEVNQDFDVLYSQVNTNISNIAQNTTDIDNLDANKANINGSSSQRFAVADPVVSGDAINKGYLESGNLTLSGDLTFSGSNTFSGDVTISGGTFDFPKCTSLPSSSSTASSTLPAVVIKNYRNGYNWYRQWSDGFLEQGGRATLGTGHSKSISLLKGYGNSSYTITLQQSGGGNGSAEYQNIQFVESVANASFTLYVGPYEDYMYWTATGYITT